MFDVIILLVELFLLPCDGGSFRNIRICGRNHGKCLTVAGCCAGAVLTHTSQRWRTEQTAGQRCCWRWTTSSVRLLTGEDDCSGGFPPSQRGFHACSVLHVSADTLWKRCSVLVCCRNKASYVAMLAPFLRYLYCEPQRQSQHALLRQSLLRVLLPTNPGAGWSLQNQTAEVSDSLLLCLCQLVPHFQVCDVL